MALKPLPRLIIIVAIVAGGAFGYNEWKKTQPKTVEPAPVTLDQVVPPAPPAPEPVKAAPEPVAPVTEPTESVSNGGAGMKALRELSNKK